MSLPYTTSPDGMRRFGLAAAVLLFAGLFITAPVAVDTVMVGNSDELQTNLSGPFTDRTIVVTGNINAGNTVFVIGSGKNITLMPGAAAGISINRTIVNTSGGGGYVHG